MTSISGIYRIVCVPNGRYYYGSAKNLTRRWSTHKQLLRRNKHENSILQNHWNKYGESSFQFELVEEVPIERLLEVETTYLSKYVGTPNCMNILSKAPIRKASYGISDVTRELHRQAALKQWEDVHTGLRPPTRPMLNKKPPKPKVIKVKKPPKIRIPKTSRRRGIHTPRNYTREYTSYHSTPEQIKRRTALNKLRRQRLATKNPGKPGLSGGRGLRGFHWQD